MYNFQMEGLRDVYKDDTRGKRIMTPIISKNSIPVVEKSPTEAINVNYPIKWEKFKTLPAALQKPYIEYLRKTFAVTNIQIGQMMGIDNSYVGKLTKRLGIKIKSEKQTDKQLEAWTDYIALGVDVSDVHMQSPVIIYKNDVESSENPNHKSLSSSIDTKLLCTKQILEFSGVMSVQRVVSMIEKAFPDGSNCSIRIEIESRAI